jgi:hypothetical protein
MSTTSESPEEIRANIEMTRRELGQDVDALADKVTPSKIVDRQTRKVTGALGSLKDRIMGAADDAKSSVSDAGHSVGHGVSDVAHNVGDVGHTVARKAQGNPLAAGLVAFGAGLLIAALIPPSDKERELASQVEEKAQPLVDKAKDVAREVGENLKEPARDAVESVKSTAQSAGQTVADEAKAGGQAVADQAKDSTERTKDEFSSTSGSSTGSGIS